MVLEELNPHLPFGNHLLGIFFCFFTGTREFFAFSIIYILDEGVRKSGIVSIQIWKGYVRKH